MHARAGYVAPPCAYSPETPAMPAFFSRSFRTQPTTHIIDTLMRCCPLFLFAHATLLRRLPLSC